jgi:hypothetical protein
MMDQELELWQEIWQVVAKRAVANVGTGKNTFAETMAALVSTAAMAIVTSGNEANQKAILDRFVKDVHRTIPEAQAILKELS